jgi:hypothetical protein
MQACRLLARGTLKTAPAINIYPSQIPALKSVLPLIYKTCGAIKGNKLDLALLGDDRNGQHGRNADTIQFNLPHSFCSL